jgi:N-acetylneuraminic acid mutarotase
LRPKNQSARLVFSALASALLLTALLTPTINHAAGQLLTSISVTPALPTIEAGQTQPFTATGSYNDGSSQALTGGGGTWTAAASLTTPRFYHTATILQDGSVLVAGGYNVTQTFATAERYYPATNTWESTGPMVSPRTGHTATLLPNGRVLIVGGIRFPQNTLYNTTELYDPASNTWSAGPNLLNGVRGFHAAVLLGTGKVLVTAGLLAYPDCTYRSTAELYNYANNSWASTGPLHLARSSATMAVLATGKVLLAAGPQNGCPTPNTGLSQAEVYDPATGVWTVTGNTSVPRYANFISLLPSGKMLLAGGTGIGGALTSVDLYDPNTGTFSLTGSMSAARQSSAGTGDNGATPLLTNGQVLVAGGSNPSTFFSSSELYSSASGTWAPTGSLNTARTYNTATLLQDGRVLAVGGLGTGSVTLGSAEIYTPKVSWTSSNPAVATIDQNGLATAVGTGTTTIDATSGSISGSTTLTVAVDEQPPATTAGYAAPNANGWYKTDVTVQLDASDSGGPVSASGVQSITYSLAGAQSGGGTVNGSSTSFAITSEGTTTVTYHAVDNKGNLEPDQTLSIKIDKTAPTLSGLSNITTSATSPAGAVVTFNPATFDSLSGVDSVAVTQGLPSGSTFPHGTANEQVKVFDKAGNSQSQSFTVTVTKTLTSIAMTPSPATITGGQNTQQFTATGSFTDGSLQVLGNTGGTWTPTGSLSTPRLYHTATRLQDGSVLVAGGYDITQTFASAERYYPLTHTWVSAGSMSIPRLGQTATLLPNGKVLVVGGISYPSNALTNTTELYDPATNNWSAGPPLTLGVREAHSAVLLNTGKVLVVAGLQSYPDCTYRNSAELYDWTTNTWAATGSLSLNRSSATTTLLSNGKVLLAGGPQNNCPTPNVGLNQAEVYDPATGTWSITGNLSVSRYANTITTLPSGKVLVAGGISTPGIVASADLYDQVAGTFSLTGSMSAVRQSAPGTGDNGATPLLFNGQVLVAGGHTNSAFLASAELYDPASATWSSTGSLNTARTYHTTTLLEDGTVLVVGGMGTGSATLGSAEVYTPPTLSWSSSSAGVAAISQTGLATASADGATTITASAGTISGTAALTVERTAPTTTATPSPLANAAGWNKSDVQVLLSAIDGPGGTGVQSIAYSYNGSQNGGPFTAPGSSTSITIGAEGTTTVNYHAIDNSGNVEGDHALGLKIDKTAPFVSYPSQVQANAGSSAGAVVNFVVSASDSLSGLVGPVGISPLASGATFPLGTTHETVMATDAAGNVRTVTFDVVVTPGRPSIQVFGGTFSADGTPHPATATATTLSGTPIAGSFTFTYVPGGTSAPVGEGRYSAAASFTSADPAFTNAFPWAAMAPDPDPKVSPTVAEINGKLYVQGFHQDVGGNQSSFQPRLSIYDPASNTWTVGTPPGIIRAYANAVAINGKMYVVGGCVMSDCNSPTNALEIYDPATGTWSNGAAMPTVRFTATAGVIGNKLYVTGGSRAGYNPTNATEIYDPATNTWTTGTPIPLTRELAMGAVVNGEFYVMGGWQRSLSAPVTRVDVFNPATGWSQRAAMPSARFGAAAGAIGGRIHVAGGAVAGNTIVGANDTYDPATNLWLGQVAMPTPRTYTSGGVVGSKLYVIDGFNGALLSANEVFDPFLTTLITILDSTPPTTTATASPAPNGAGWNRTNVDVSLNASDSAGVQSIVYSYNGSQNGGPFTVPGNSTSFTIGSDGTTTVNYHAVDNFGNVESDHALMIKIDKGAPNLSYPNQANATATSSQGAVVSFGVSANDSLSGVVSGPTISTTFNGSPVVPALVGGSTFPIGTTTETLTATDAAGNTATATFNVIVSPGDTTPPTTNANYQAPNANGWNRFNVGVSLNAFDSSNDGPPSGVKSITYSLTGAQTGGGTFNTSSTSFTISTEGTTTVTYHATDNRDNVEADHTFTVKLDKTQPTAASLSNIQASATSAAGAVVTFDLAPADALSGVDTVVFTQGLTSGSTFPHGTTSESVTITDKGGNTTFRSFSVTVNKTLLSIAVSPSTASIFEGDSQPFQATGHFTSGPDQLLPSGSGGGGSGGSGGSGGGGGTFFGNYWQIQFPSNEMLNLGACGNAGSYVSQAFSASSGSTQMMFGSVHTTWGFPAVVQVDGTITAQEVHLTLSCIPGNGATGSVDAFWTGTRFDGTWSFSGSSGHTTVLGWSTKAPLSAPRFSFGAGTVNGIVYAIGGNNPSLPSPVEAYNPADNTWSTVSQLPISSEGPAVAVLNGIIYVAGGHVSGGVASGVLQGYNPVTNTWLSGLASMPTARSHVALVAAGGTLYAIGGETGSGSGTPTAVVEQYDPVGNAWIVRAPMTTARANLVAGALNSDSVIIAAGGTGGTTELYNVAGNSWSSGPAMLSSGGSPAAVVVNNALFVFGVGGNSTQMFRPTGTQPTGWAGLALMPTSRGQLAVAAVGDVVYAIGGQLPGGSTTTAVVEAFSTPLPSNFTVSSGSGGSGGSGGGGFTLPTVQWSSADASIASIDSFGHAEGNAPGQTTIIATAAGVSCAATNACATLTVVPQTHITFTLAPGSLSFPAVTVTVVDRVTGEAFETFDVPIGEPQDVGAEEADEVRLLFTAPAGYLVSPTEVEPNLHNGDLVIPLLFSPADTTPPAITAPADVTAEATSSSGAFVDPGQATATDDVGPVTITRDPSSNPFPIGTTPILWTATDGSGKFSTATQLVTVVDTTPPTIAAPANVTAEATGPSGAFLNPGAAIGSDIVGPVTITRMPAGNQFPLGTTQVVWRATDGSGNFSEATQQIAVVDTTKPVLTLPGNITVDATGPAGAIVTYLTSAVDIVSGNVPVICSRASGTTFQIGTTIVSCTATDAASNATSSSFQVLVQAAAAQVSNLIVTVQTFNLAQGIQNSLDTKLQNVLSAMNAALNGNVSSVCGQLVAFINETSAQSGKKLTVAQANQLIATADQIQAVVGCP